MKESSGTVVWQVFKNRCSQDERRNQHEKGMRKQTTEWESGKSTVNTAELTSPSE